MLKLEAVIQLGPASETQVSLEDRPRTRPFGSRGGVDPQLNLRRIRRKYRSQLGDGIYPSPFWLKALSFTTFGSV